MSEEKKETKIKNGQVLAFPIPIRCEETIKKLRETLDYVQKKTNEYLEFAHEHKLYDVFAEEKGKYAYKILEPIFVEMYRKSQFPSRINRGVLEIVGRTMRQVRDRKSLFCKLISICSDPKKWTSRLLQKEGLFVKEEYVKNLKEQVINYRRKHNELPKDFYELQKAPKVKEKILTYAPDDKQAIKIEIENNHIALSLKVIEREKEKIKWKWLQTTVKIPDFLQDKQITAPDLRFDCIRGDWLPVLDFKITIERKPKVESDNFVTVDWGTRKIATCCVFNTRGEQISQPIFLHFTPLQKKLTRIRMDIGQWKSKRDKLEHKDSLFKKCNREIARRWKKFTAINQEIAHTTANVIVFIAQQYNCSKIYCEHLKSLKSKNKSAQLNWIINTTVRQKIYSLANYKASLCGISLAKPLSPAGTSSICPKCSHSGHHIKSSDRKNQKKKSFSWFSCSHCNFSADRDYVATLNLARKVIYKKNLKQCKKSTVYKKDTLSDQLLRQTALRNENHSRSRTHYLKGWTSSLFLSSTVVLQSFNSHKGTIFGILRV